MRFRNRVAACMVAAALLLGAGVAVAPSASAVTYGYVYISLPTWLANCPNGGKVVTISGTVDNVSSVSMDRGDDIVYMKVILNYSNRVQFTAFCNKWPAGYWQPGFSQVIRPTRNNQTWWVGPAGVRNN